MFLEVQLLMENLSEIFESRLGMHFVIRTNSVLCSASDSPIFSNHDFICQIASLDYISTSLTWLATIAIPMSFTNPMEVTPPGKSYHSVIHSVPEQRAEDRSLW